MLKHSDLTGLQNWPALPCLLHCLHSLPMAFRVTNYEEHFIEINSTSNPIIEIIRILLIIVIVMMMQKAVPEVHLQLCLLLLLPLPAHPCITAH